MPHNTTKQSRKTVTLMMFFLCLEFRREHEQLPANKETRAVYLWHDYIDYIFCAVLEAPIGMKIVLQFNKLTLPDGLRMFVYEDIKSKPVLQYYGSKVRLQLVMVNYTC